MITGAWVCVGLLAAVQAQAGKPASATAAERVTLRDGSTVLGLIITPASGARGGLEMLVRRDWAERNQKTRVVKWDRAIQAAAKLAVRQRSQRLAAWKRERAAAAPPDDRILAWINRELVRLADPAALAPTPLLPVSLARGDVRAVVRQPAATTRLLQLGWLCRFPDVETTPLEQLEEALESRGFSPSGTQTPSLAPLLPLLPEAEPLWLARRAASELAVDSGLRLLRYQGLVLPDSPAGQDLGGLNLTAALSGLTRLLDPEGGKDDPLAAALKPIGARGRVGALVTSLDFPADLRQVTVEAALWIRLDGQRWVPFLTRTGSARPEDAGPDAGANLADDPQVKTAFSLVEALGLGSLPPDVKARSLRMGAATQRALGEARAAINQDLNSLMLPVLEAAPGEAAPPPGPAARKPAGPDSETARPR